MLERAPAKETMEASVVESWPVQVPTDDLAERVAGAVADGLRQAESPRADSAHLLAAELVNVLSPEWDLAGVSVLRDADGLPLFEVLLTDSGQWMRQENLPTNFHGFPVVAVIVSKTAAPIGPSLGPYLVPRREMWDDLIYAALLEADQPESAQRLDPCPGCDGGGRVHELSAIICATCGGSGRASDKMAQRSDGSIYSAPRASSATPETYIGPERGD